MNHVRLLVVGTLLLCGIHCTEAGSPTGILIPANSGGLAPYETEGWGGTESANNGEDGSFGVERGPLCIGLTPPEDAYLPLEVEPDVTEDAEDERDIEGDVEEVADVELTDTESPDGSILLTDVVLTDAEEDVEGDTSGGTMQTFAVDTTDTQSDTDAAADSDASSGRIPLPPAPEVEEEEPYDCTPLPQTCIGADAPESFELFDFQPQSCGFQATYGLSLYKNHVTMVALLAAW